MAREASVAQRIIVTDRESIEQGFVVRAAYLLISIRDPDKRPVRLPRGGACIAVLELAFHDAEPVAGFTPDRPITYMSADDARAIWRFVRRHEGQYGAIVVHCEQGMSRSPAVAAALAEGLGLDASAFWREYQPNEYVYALVSRQSGGSALNQEGREDAGFNAMGSSHSGQEDVQP